MALCAACGRVVDAGVVCRCVPCHAGVLCDVVFLATRNDNSDGVARRRKGHSTVVITRRNMFSSFGTQTAPGALCAGGRSVRHVPGIVQPYERRLQLDPSRERYACAAPG